jgi:hypothetical protein
MRKSMAQAIARCISVIAQDSAKVAVIDQDQRANCITAFNAQARVALVESIEKHEASLAAWLENTKNQN